MGKRDKMSLAIVALLSVVAYWPSLTGGFIWDDPDYVVNNQTLRTVEGLGQIWFKPQSLPQYYPLVHTTFWIEYHLWGLHPHGYKIVNLLLHLSSAWLVYRLLKCLNVPGAVLAASIFALHPVMLESVAWITERKNTLSLVFYLTSLLVYFKADDSRRVRFSGPVILSLALFLCALLSKTTACSLPAAILLILWWKHGRIKLRELLVLIPFFMLGIAMALVTAHLEKTHVRAIGKDWEFTLPQRLLIAGRALWFYAAKLLWPANLSFIYPRWTIDTHAWWQWIYPIAFAILVAILFTFRNRIGRGPLVAVLFFAGTLLPALGFINVYPMRYSFVADHFQYTASLGLIVLFAAVVARLFKSAIRNPQSAIQFALLIPITILTWRQAHIYENTLTLWTDTTTKNPGSWMAWLNLGHAYVEAGDPASSMRCYRQAMEIADDEPDPHFNVGYSLALQGDYPAAIQQYQRAIQLDSHYAQAWYSMGNAYRELKDPQRALECYQEALKIEPTYAVADNNIATILQDRGDFPGAIAHYQSAITADPFYARPRFNLANIYLSQGRLNEALELYDQAATLDPTLRSNIDRILRQRGLALP
jgi:tetratricopeptide (TPR) repeat protein